jgi:hypothetical protein
MQADFYSSESEAAQWPKVGFDFVSSLATLFWGFECCPVHSINTGKVICHTIQPLKFLSP